jgi:hypothetical protein
MGPRENLSHPLWKPSAVRAALLSALLDLCSAWNLEPGRVEMQSGRTGNGCSRSRLQVGSYSSATAPRLSAFSTPAIFARTLVDTRSCRVRVRAKVKLGSTLTTIWHGVVKCRCWRLRWRLGWRLGHLLSAFSTHTRKRPALPATIVNVRAASQAQLPCSQRTCVPPSRSSSACLMSLPFAHGTRGAVNDKTRGTHAPHGPRAGPPGGALGAPHPAAASVRAAVCRCPAPSPPVARARTAAPCPPCRDTHCPASIMAASGEGIPRGGLGLRLGWRLRPAQDAATGDCTRCTLVVPKRTRCTLRTMTLAIPGGRWQQRKRAWAAPLLELDAVLDVRVGDAADVMDVWRWEWRLLPSVARRCVHPHTQPSDPPSSPSAHAPNPNRVARLSRARVRDSTRGLPAVRERYPHEVARQPHLYLNPGWHLHKRREEGGSLIFPPCLHLQCAHSPGCRASYTGSRPCRAPRHSLASSCLHRHRATHNTGLGMLFRHALPIRPRRFGRSDLPLDATAGTPNDRHSLWLNSLYAAQHGHTFKVDTGDTVHLSGDGDARWTKVGDAPRRWVLSLRAWKTELLSVR